MPIPVFVDDIRARSTRILVRGRDVVRPPQDVPWSWRNDMRRDLAAIQNFEGLSCSDLGLYLGPVRL